MNIDYDKILNQINQANMQKKNDSKTNDDNILVIKDINNIIVGRFIPNINNPENTVFHYFHHGFKSKITNDEFFFLCPNTFGKKCPICKESVGLWKQKADPVKKQLSEGIRRRENYIANFYVISDKLHPENNGKVKILRYGKTIQQKYEIATSGMDKEIYGSRIYRLDEQGCSFRIVTSKSKDQENTTSSGSVDNKVVWPSYSNSSFMPAIAITGMTNEKIHEILTTVKDLSTYYKSTPEQEMSEILYKHFLIQDASSQTIIDQSVKQQETVILKTQPETVNTSVVIEQQPSTQTQPQPVVAESTTVVDTQKVENAENSEIDEIDRMLSELQQMK